MNLYELTGNDLPEANHRTEKDDNTVLSLHDLRKTKLTLTQLNRLRIMNDIRRLEHEQKLTKVKAQYKPAETEAPMM